MGKAGASPTPCAPDTPPSACACRPAPPELVLGLCADSAACGRRLAKEVRPSPGAPAACSSPSSWILRWMRCACDGPMQQQLAGQSGIGQ